MALTTSTITTCQNGLTWHAPITHIADTLTTQMQGDYTDHIDWARQIRQLATHQHIETTIHNQPAQITTMATICACGDNRTLRRFPNEWASITFPNADTRRKAFVATRRHHTTTKARTTK